MLNRIGTKKVLQTLMVAAIVFALLPTARAQQMDDDPALQNMAAESQDGAQQPDPPSQVARISLLQGNVSIEPASVDQFTAAEANYPLTTGDRIYADQGALAELQTDQLAIRLGQFTDLTVTAVTDTLAQFGLAQGSVHLRSFSLDPNTVTELDTPNVAVTILQPGDVRVDVDPNSDTTTVWLISGQVQIDGNGLQQTLQPGQRVSLSGADPVSARWLYAATPDGLDSFSEDRDAAYQSESASEGQYVNPETIGAEDLAANGQWDAGDADGAVWYPSSVAVGWAPYTCGRWGWIAPWGWTWIPCERWGFAPFHYGRWSYFPDRHRWGWRPGPPVIRPIYSPALVVFVGGGPGVTAWFPLGPHEPYVPWYHASPRYINRVNVSGIYNRNTSQVKELYNQRTLNPAFAPSPDRSYANRRVATTAVSQTSFAAGRPVATAVVRINPDQLAVGPVLPHPLVTPERTMVVGSPARVQPVRTARPTLDSREDNGVKPVAKEPLAREPVAREPVAAAPLGIPARAIGPARPNGLATDIAPQPKEPTPAAPVSRSQPTSQPERQYQQPAPVARVPATETPAPAQRPLFNRAVPPQPRPSFEEQQKAMQSSDPGRPLSPVQMQNIRQNQPAGPARQPEAPHPAPARPGQPAPRPTAPEPAPAAKH
jgi:hypothetical protein